MNIAFYVKTYDGVKGGIERLISMLTENLPKEYKITLFLDCEKWESFPYKLQRNISIHKLPFRGDSFFIDDLRNIIIKEEIEAVVVMRTGSNVMQTWAATLSGTNCKLILSEHCEPTAAGKEYPKQSRKIALECADYIHLLQNAFTESIPENIRHRVRVIPNYIINKKEKVKPFSTRENRIVMVGRLTKTQKRPIKLLEAFGKLCERREDIKKNWELVFCGDGPEKEGMLEFIKKNEIHNVHLLGQVHDVDSILLNSKLFCLPSAYEGQSIALMEAMNCGCIPIVYSSSPGNNTMVQDRLTGYLSGEDLSLTLESAIDSGNNDEICRNTIEEINKYSIEFALSSWDSFFKEISSENTLFRNRHLIKKGQLINILINKEFFTW